MSRVNRLLFVGTDLAARSRLEIAARRAGAELATANFGSIADALRATPSDVLVIDLDGGREPALVELEQARSEGLLPERVLAYYSHVDDALAEAARASGLDPIPRGRFWRQLHDLIA
jgi:FAD/FMN-containing dehydrogenase